VSSLTSLTKIKVAAGKTSITKIEIETQISLHSMKVNKKTIKKVETYLK